MRRKSQPHHAARNKTRQELPATVRSTVPMTKCPHRTVLPNSNYSEDDAAWGVKLGSL